MLASRDLEHAERRHREPDDEHRQTAADQPHDDRDEPGEDRDLGDGHGPERTRRPLPDGAELAVRLTLLAGLGGCPLDTLLAPRRRHGARGAPRL